MTPANQSPSPPESVAQSSPLARTLRFFIEQKLVVAIMTTLLVGWGIAVAPFDWELDWMPRDPVPVDAIPNLGENQQIVFTDWPGRSPQDVEDQVTYPLTVQLLGVPGVREVRSLSMFGFSSIFVIFEEEIEFYWSRARIVEQLNSLPAGTLPEGVQPVLGPDATGLGQIFWYTLEGRDPDGNPSGGWDLQETRAIQDWYVRFGLQSAEGISEVASIGGFVPEYQIDVDPDALRANGATLPQVLNAVRRSNLDIGARTTEINRVEYVIRGLGFIKNLDDIESATVRMGQDNTPIRVRDVAHVTRGPAPRRGALTIGGAEAVGGVVVVREGFNPLRALTALHAKIDEIRPGLPSKAVIDWNRTDPKRVRSFAQEHGFSAYGEDGALSQDTWLHWLRGVPREEWPEWITRSDLTIVPVYDRTGLIYETLATLNDALIQQTLVTIIVVVVMVLHLRAAAIVSFTLPLAVLMAFIGMKLAGVDANVVALAGIAIAIGTIVDMGVIVTENVLKHLRDAPPGEPTSETVLRGASEVGSAILTAICTTVVSFLPVFTMTGAEGKMFIPLAYTKTFVLVAAIFIALTIVPAAVHLFVARRKEGFRPSRSLLFGLGAGAVVLAIWALSSGWGWVLLAALILMTAVLLRLFGGSAQAWLKRRHPAGANLLDSANAFARRRGKWIGSAAVGLAVAVVLARVWEPIGPESGSLANLLFVILLIGGLLGAFGLFAWAYEPMLRWCLRRKALFLSLPTLLILFGAIVWLGFDSVFRVVPAGLSKIGISEERMTRSGPWVWAAHEFPGLGREFMPPLDEGSFLWMPTTMPHASIGEALDVLKTQDMAISAIPEVELVVGKIGRADTALDPAPVSMIETIVHYKPEYMADDDGRRINFRYDRRGNAFVRDEDGKLIPDSRGRPYRQWREEIRSPDDIWDRIARAAHIPGTTSAPKLQPIETRLVMLQTGMRAPMGLKVRAPDLETLDEMAVQLEAHLRDVPQIRPQTVNADRVVGKPYLEIDIDREAIGRYGLNIVDAQDALMTAAGGVTVTETVEGRERFPVRIRYARERRNTIEDLQEIILDTSEGAQIPLAAVSNINYVQGPQMIRSEDTFLVAYVTFGGQPGIAEVDVVEAAAAFLDSQVASGNLIVPQGVSWKFSGNYEHQLRAAKTLSVVLPVSLAIIFLILYFQFRSVPTTLMVFSGILVAWAGGFAMIYAYGESWFANFSLFGVNMRELFQLQAINLSVAVWVGFLALFGIAVDNGVVVATYLQQSFERRATESIEQIREASVEAGLRRLRPCLMTTATTILALLPVLTSTGRGSDIMIPMAIPSVGGMAFVLLTLLTVPTLYCWMEESKRKRQT